MKHLSLGSRKNLCINAKVSALSSNTAINERCLDLQQPGEHYIRLVFSSRIHGASDDRHHRLGTPAAKKCPYLPIKDNEAQVHSFRDHALARIRDIEELGNLGKKLAICPYYASRSAIKPSEVCPYQKRNIPSRGAVDMLKMVDRHPDCHTSIPIAAAEVCPRSAGPVPEGPCCGHRRSTQPH